VNRIITGNIGEQAAAAFLQHSGYKILAQNFRCKTGEIDIIAEHCGVIVFVEVKTRRNTLFGSPAEAVTHKKQQKIIKTALYYLNMIRKPYGPCRFDILEVFLVQHQNPSCNHIVNAFGS
jgi:putative endonuclease